MQLIRRQTAYCFHLSMYEFVYVQTVQAGLKTYGNLSTNYKLHLLSRLFPGVDGVLCLNRAGIASLSLP
jgi:hypothetical protein